MGSVFKCDLSVKKLRELEKQIRNYKNQILVDNMDRFVDELSKIGYTISYNNRGEFKDYIEVRRDLQNTKYNYQAKAVVIVFNSAENIVEWIRGGATVSAEVNSVLMAEYGSGQHSRNGWRGTFPNQTHAFEDFWFWIDADGKQHSQEGVEPSRPIQRAYLEMWLSLYNVGRRCFETNITWG